MLDGRAPAHVGMEGQARNHDIPISQEAALFVIGGHGYVGSRVVAFAATQNAPVEVVSRVGDRRHGTSSTSWATFLDQVRHDRQAAAIWLLDGAKHNEPDRLGEFLDAANPAMHLVFVSTCTVYGDRHGDECGEDTPLSLVTPHAQVKAAGESVLAASDISWSVLRLGALYGPDDRGVRTDRVTKWVTQAAEKGVVTVPDPTHWRGWLHRDQAARALWRAADQRIGGIFNVASANHRFGDAGAMAAGYFGGVVEADGVVDMCDYRIAAAKARHHGLLDETAGEDLAATIETYAKAHFPTAKP